jgi:hypothetical protein
LGMAGVLACCLMLRKHDICCSWLKHMWLKKMWGPPCHVEFHHSARWFSRNKSHAISQ